MGINSYITHRMFVAALSHDEDTSAKDALQQPAQQPARELSAKDPWEAHVNAMARAKQNGSSWSAPAPTVGA